MGYHNVAAAFTLWSSQLTDHPFRLLMYMAHVALDPPTDGQPSPRRPPRRFFGGRDALAEIGLGRPLPALPAPTDRSEDAREARAARAKAHKSVKAALTLLRDAGAIEVEQAGYAGHNTEYRLVLEVKGPSQTAPGSRKTAPIGPSQTTPGALSDDDQGPSQTAPKEDARTRTSPAGADHVPALTHLRTSQVATR